MFFVAAKVCHLRNIDYKVCFIEKEKSFNVTFFRYIERLLLNNLWISTD